MYCRKTALHPQKRTRLLPAAAPLLPRSTPAHLLHVIASHVLATAHTSFLLHVIARSGAAAPRRGKLFHAHYQADTAPVQTARYDSTLGYSRRVLNYIAKNYTKAIGLDDIAREIR